jgi:hypothetical protein
MIKLKRIYLFVYIDKFLILAFSLHDKTIAWRVFIWTL